MLGEEKRREGFDKASARDIVVEEVTELLEGAPFFVF